MLPIDGAAFTGRWEDSEGALLDIDGSTMTDSNGVEVGVSFDDEGECLLRAGSEVFRGRLSPDGSELVWSDGAVWLRRAAAAGAGRAEEPSGEAARGHGRPQLALERVLELQRELEGAFSEEGFRRRLREVEARHGRAHVQCTPEHTRLFQTVQSAVLPKYGFAPGQKGVLDMLDVGASFNDSQEFRQQRLRLNQLLGLIPTDDERQEQQLHAAGVQITVRHYFDGTELIVTVPSSSTFRELKEAISKSTGREEVLRKGHLVKKEGGVYSAYRDRDAIGAVRQVALLGAELTVRDDAVAEAWRRELRACAASRGEEATADAAPAVQRPAADSQAYSSRTWSDIKPAGANQIRRPPHGPCYLVGTWDDHSGRKELEWDGCAYRGFVQVRNGEEDESFQILAGSTSWERRIYPSIDGANPLVQHWTLGPDGKGHGFNWTIRDAAPGARYEVVLSCPRGRPMSVAWSRAIGQGR